MLHEISTCKFTERLDDSLIEFAAQFGKALSYKTTKNNTYPCLKYFTQLFIEQQKLKSYKTSISARKFQ